MKYLVYVCVLFLCGSSAAQSVGTKVHIVTKGGSVINGTLISESETDMHIRLSFGDTVALGKDYIKKSLDSEKVFIHKRGKFHYKSGWFAGMNLALWGYGSEVTSQFDLQVGYRLTTKLHLGLGNSFSYSDVAFADTWIIHEIFTPYAIGRFYPGNKRRQRFFVEAKLGYGFVDQENVEGGPNVQPGIGWHFASKNKFKLYAGLTQFIWQTSGTHQQFDFNGNPVVTEYDMWYNRTLVKVGLQFH